MKHFCRLAACFALAGCLVGCGLQDGKYTAATNTTDSLGYQAYLTVTLTKGKISEVEFDAQNASGQKKSKDSQYAALMRPVSGKTPSEVSDHYRDLLLNAKRPSAVKPDMLSGATVSSQEFARLWKALQPSFRNGTPESITLEPAPELQTTEPVE